MRFGRYGQGVPGATPALAASTGPPLVLLHGIPQTHLMWHRVAPTLAEHLTWHTMSPTEADTGCAARYWRLD
ncbi:alpha/beta fold hydrolase [Pseudonocardia spinosispora]|uniref:alpha/beta fold hydrolase n=1 Tax=Pseudonocardia spinosispora TaxID=103441 RepID=UPI00040AD785|nr:hypothetical protein [Pseudonocardia spinosispora]